MDIHTTGDPTLPVQVENAYHRTVAAAGSGALLRRAYVDNAGHCAFSPAERLGALNTLEDRITTGHWPDTDATALNNRAAVADPTPRPATSPTSPAPIRAPTISLTQPTAPAPGYTNRGRGLLLPGGPGFQDHGVLHPACSRWKAMAADAPSLIPSASTNRAGSAGQARGGPGPAATAGRGAGPA